MSIMKKKQERQKLKAKECSAPAPDSRAAEALLSRELVTDIEKKAVGIVEKLREKGHTAFFVGGYVRDVLRSEEPKDIDIATSATPDEVKKLFHHTIEVGEQFGVVIVVAGDFQFEVATFRAEGRYEDGRRPQKVELVNEVFEDAARRDFTFNALYFDPVEKRVIDFFGGISDLEKKVLRFVGDPKDVLDHQDNVAYERVAKEDHLRILRAVRFAARFGLAIDPKAERVLREQAGLLQRVSAERVRDELTKMFADNNRLRALALLEKIDALGVVLPELEFLKGVAQPEEFHSEGDVWAHTKKVFSSLERVFAEENGGEVDEEVVWAALFHDIGKPSTFSHHKGDRIRFNNHDKIGGEMARSALRRLRFPGQTVKDIQWLVSHHMFARNFDTMREAKRRRYALHPLMPKLLMVMKADLYGTEPLHMEFFHEVKEIYEQAKKQGIEEERKKIAEIITGKDLMQHFNLSPGPFLGIVKEVARNACLEGAVKDKKEAVAWLDKHISAIEKAFGEYPPHYWRKQEHKQQFITRISEDLFFY